MHFPSGNNFVGAKEAVALGVCPHPGGSLLAAEVRYTKIINLLAVSPWQLPLQRDPGSGEVLLLKLDLMYAHLKSTIY